MRHTEGVHYAILLQPSANRVYTGSAIDLLAAELAIMSDAVLDSPITEIRSEEIAGVPYLRFTAPELSDRDVFYLSNLSGIYALFAVQGEQPMLAPRLLNRLDVFDDDLITIQKYKGKTNEQFTKLLLNVAVLSSASATRMLTEPLRVLDPLCGRGTTLNQALMYGYQGAGVDTDGGDIDAYWAFLRTWVKDKRIKHQASAGPVRRNKKTLGKRADLEFGLTKEDYKNGDTRTLSLVRADTTAAGDFFSPGSFDVIVTDAPYGVAHGSHTGGGLQRRPLDLIAGAIGPWKRLLAKGGTVAMSWNTKVAAREQVTQVLTGAGLTVLDDGPYLNLGHRVDASIMRDVIVARKD